MTVNMDGFTEIKFKDLHSHQATSSALYVMLELRKAHLLQKKGVNYQPGDDRRGIKHDKPKAIGEEPIIIHI